MTSCEVLPVTFYFTVTAKDMEKRWMELSGAAAAADPDRARDYDKSYASKLQRLGDDFQDRDCRQDQSQQVQRLTNRLTLFVVGHGFS